jgi:hypothetical protein
MSNGVSQFVTMELPLMPWPLLQHQLSWLLPCVPSFERYNQTTRPTGEQWVKYQREIKRYCWFWFVKSLKASLENWHNETKGCRYDTLCQDICREGHLNWNGGWERWNAKIQPCGYRGACSVLVWTDWRRSRGEIWTPSVCLWKDYKFLGWALDHHCQTSPL